MKSSRDRRTSTLKAEPQRTHHTNSYTQTAGISHPSRRRWANLEKANRKRQKLAVIKAVQNVRSQQDPLEDWAIM